MKKILLLIGLTTVLLNSQGQFSHEPFSYTPDPTNGIYTQSSGSWVRINTGDSILVTSGSLSYPGLPVSTGNKIAFDGTGSDNYRIFGTAITSGSVYYSFILNLSALGSLTTTGGYFTGLLQTASTSAFGATIRTRLSTTVGKYNIGISTRSNSAVSWLAADLDPGTSYFVVGAYDIIAGSANDVARIWLNTSAIGSAEPAADATAVAGTDLGAAGIERIFIRQDNATNTPFVEIDEIRVGTTWTSVTPGGAVPTLSISSPLPVFGDVCINTSAGPNSFTITGSNLTTADVTVAALAGYTYSTTAGGTYTTTLNITQPGGTLNQQIFVRFDPLAVQSYNGNIAVAGGGVTIPVNAAASGAGVNTIPSLTTGNATAITQVSATLAGTITANGCTPVTAYGIEYSTVSGFPNGSGTQVASTNIGGGNYTSDITGLTFGTTYYYKAYATNGGGTGYGTEQSFTTATPNPTISTTPLTAFGDVCINTTAGPNSFTISGANLTTADVTVGPLAGFTYSTTAGGTYTTSLTLTQPGGTFLQEIFVRFSPTVVQSYSGDIVVGGGGVAAPVNVPASGAGVNTTASVTTGSASAITTTTATLAGSVTASGCTAVSAYGIEYSTINGFVNGTGTQVASGNISGGNFTSALSGLTASTTYYYKAYATNAGGTAYGAQQSFTTAAPPPPAITVAGLNPFGSICINATAGPESFTINGVNLTAPNINVGPLAGYSFDTIATGPYSASLSIPHPLGTFSKTVYVKFNPTLVQSYNGNIPVTGGGTTTAANVAAVGSGVNTLATVITGAASTLTTQSATLAGSVSSNGCSNVTVYGIEYSSISGFANGSGTQVASSNIAGGNFSVSLSGLVQGATYYYKAYAINNGGISYGLQQSFTVLSIKDGFSLYPNPVDRGTDIRITMTGITPGYYGLLLFNSGGQLVYQRNMNIQSNFINQTFTVPATLQKGIYRANLTNHLEIIGTITILVQ